MTLFTLDEAPTLGRHTGIERAQDDDAEPRPIGMLHPQHICCPGTSPHRPAQHCHTMLVMVMACSGLCLDGLHAVIRKAIAYAPR